MQQGDKVAIVTRASMGIGQASAEALHQAGFRVFGTSRRAVASVSEGVGMITCDVTDDASVKKPSKKCSTRRAGLTFWSTMPGSASSAELKSLQSSKPGRCLM